MSTTLTTYIDGKQVMAPKGWQDMTIKAAFGDDSLRPQIEIDALEFAGDGVKIIKDFFDAGNAFRSLPVTMVFNQNNKEATILKGKLDFSQGYTEHYPQFKGTEDHPLSVEVRFVQDESINNFLDKINGVTYGSLLEEHLITTSDFVTIKTAVVKKADFLEIATTLITIYILQKQLQEVYDEIKNTVKSISAITTGGGVTGGLGAVIYLIASLLIQVAYAAVMVALLFKLVTEMMDLLLPPLLNNKGMTLRKLLTKACEKFGYEFNSNITELETYHYLPSKPHSNSEELVAQVADALIPQYIPNGVGIPSTSDYGYLLNEMFDLVKRKFRTKIEVLDNVVHLHNVDDPFWDSLSTFTPHAPPLFPTKEYNTEELKHTRMMTFLTDPNDVWTFENYKGTSYEIKTTSQEVGAVKGLDRIEIPAALGNSKNKFSLVESYVRDMAAIADLLAKAIGKNTSFESLVEERINILKVGSNDYTMPKIVLLEDRKMPTNHRDKLSSKFLMDKFHKGKSFVVDGRRGQKIFYRNFEMAFNLNDFINVSRSGSFVLEDGRRANFLDIEYNVSKDKCLCSISIEEPYASHLTESYYEPE